MVRERKAEVAIPQVQQGQPLSKRQCALDEPYMIYSDTSRMADEINFSKVDYVLCSQDIEFAKSGGLVSDAQLCYLIDLFEKASGPLNMKGGFERILLFPDLLAKVHAIKPALQSELTNLPGSKPLANLQQTLQEVYTYWRKRRAQLGSVLLRQFWRRYDFSSEDPNAIFRDRHEDKSMKLRKKTKNEVDTYFKIKGLYKVMVHALGLAHETVRRERRKYLLGVQESLSFEERLKELCPEELNGDQISSLQRDFNDFYEREVKNEDYPARLLELQELLHFEEELSPESTQAD